jgi:hypothetical protein
MVSWAGSGSCAESHFRLFLSAVVRLASLILRGEDALSGIFLSTESRRNVMVPGEQNDPSRAV